MVFVQLWARLKLAKSLLSHFALAGIGSLAFATLTPLPTVAAPGITVQASFAADGSNGATPLAALTAAGNGIYYGTTSNGGASGNGAIFAFNSATGSITLKDSFSGSSNGANPAAALTAAGNGIYYGTTSNGGANGNGAIFAFNSATGSITLKGSFSGSNGANPLSALTFAGNGIYYGTTKNGGANGNGAIFAFDSATGSITLKDSFSGSIGVNPQAALTAAGNGIYYGTTRGGGANGNGTIFSFNSTTGSITLNASFAAGGSNGSISLAALTAAGNGLYYGTTNNGGANNNGTIFAFDSATGLITLKGSFGGASNDGYGPQAALTAAGNGIYYGTTLAGGANNYGTIFAFNSATGSITFQDFSSSNGANPTASLVAAGNGLYYGTTQLGGLNNNGAIFAFDSGVRDPPVPGPLPLMGAGAAFGWSRRLRRRIRQVRPVVPMGR